MTFERSAERAGGGELALPGEPVSEPALSPERAHEGLLVRRILAGESHLFANLMQPCSRQIKAVALRALGNRPEVEDIAQETAIKAFTSLDRFRHQARFQTWVTSIAVNEVRQFLRSSRSQRLESLDTAYAGSNSGSRQKINRLPARELAATESVFRGQLKELLSNALGRLPEKLRMVLILRDLEDLSIRQTADRLNLSVSAVKSRHFRARRSLQRLCTPYRGILFVNRGAPGMEGRSLKTLASTSDSSA